MDNELKRNIRLGFFVILGITIFIVGIFLIGNKSEMFTKTFLISTQFKNTGGLKVGSNVRFNGVKIGVVKKIALINDSAVEVDMQIENSKRNFVHKNAIASISSDGLMGDKLVNIEPGKGDTGEVEAGDIITARNSFNTDAMMQTLNATNENAKVITDNLKNVTSDLNSKNGSIQSLYKDSTMANNLKQTARNLEAMSDEVKRVGVSLQQITYKMQNGNGTVGEMLNDTVLGKNLSNTVAKLKETSDKLDNATDQLSVTFKHINSGPGSVNAVLTDSIMSTDLKRSVANFKKASKDLDDDMMAIRHSILLRGFFKNRDTTKRK